MTNDAYAEAGVDTHAGDLAVELMKRAVSATHNDLVVGGLGGFAGMIDISFVKNYKKPLLATSTDGVGTKVAIAQAIDKHDTIGQDLVGMVVDDIVVVGAKSLFMTDYIACGKSCARKNCRHRARHCRGVFFCWRCTGRWRNRRAPGIACAR